MTTIKPVSRRWFLGGLIAAPVIVAASNIMPVRAMEWIGAPRWEGTAGDFAWRTRPDKLVPTNQRFAWHQDRTTKIWEKVELAPASMQPDIELVHRNMLPREEWAQACRQGSSRSAGFFGRLGDKIDRLLGIF
jgi:hypothetical protein